MIPNDHPLAAMVCPHCKAEHDTATDFANSRSPKEGCVSVCVDCAMISVFAADLSLRLPTISELVAFQEDLQFWGKINQLQAAVCEVQTT